MKALEAGAAAPDFEVPAVLGSEKMSFRLSDFRGKKNVVLVFYVLDWTPT
jgi:peroxiredoxin (alkyl hydroperoxide reductase subunit C)